MLCRHSTLHEHSLLAWLGMVLCAALVLAQDSQAQDQGLLGLPSDVTYDPSIPTPASVLGWDVGTWHVRPDQIVIYMEALAAASDRVQIETYGFTHEQRPLLLATISAPGNLARIDDIQSEHVAAVRAGASPTADRPVIVWMGYSVHGNEPSGANASLLVAYYLAAAQGPEIETLLSTTVVLLDPCINPDGLGRFAHWVNMHKGRQLVAEGWSQEHREAWPSGRTNHYWSDLNRDWLLLTHPESQGRIAKFQAWKPNLLTDHHEMGTDSTFFFQPGVPSRQNPRTPPANLELTRSIANFHADALDEDGRIYYSEESFDDFYYGKGSTYPDVQGGVGILFEQASSRGHLQENAWGPLEFQQTITNQVTVSLSSLRAAHALHDELLQLQADAVNSARDEAASDAVAAYVFGHPKDAVRVALMADLLRQHDIAVYPLAEDLSADGVSYEVGSAFVVPTDQLQYRLIKSLFETRTEFEDDTFYDVSTWVLPMAFGLDYAEVPRGAMDVSRLGVRLEQAPVKQGSLARSSAGEMPVAYVFEWSGLHAPRALARLHAMGVVPQVATRPFRGTTADGPRAFDYGAILVPIGVQAVERATLDALMQTIALEDGLDVHSLTTGWTPEGPDLGSPSVLPLEPPRPVLLTGSGVSSYEAGEVWHQLDLRWEQPVALADLASFDRIDLGDVTHVLMVGGGDQLTTAQVDSLRAWIRKGGVLVASGSASSWATRTLLGESSTQDAVSAGSNDGDDVAKKPESEQEAEKSYADYEADRAKTLVGGSIFETRVDLTHPLAYGYVRDRLPVFRKGTKTLARSKNPYADALVYTDTPLLSGYASPENEKKIAGSVAATAQRLGRGTVVRFADDPLFRGVWYGTSKLYANALYFGGIVKSTKRVGGVGEASEVQGGTEH
ncbi:MAG: M14 family metallopeptidase [Planctomycetota bacterium]|jgi:hypothetical protein|nr:M14 family metallopeptidase [Planctomycetota bacterium]